MSDDLNTEIKIGADATGVEAGVGRAKRSLADLGASAKKAGKDAGDGVGTIGAGGDKAARDLERATKSMQGSLQRVLAEQKAGARGSREYYEALADARGISRSAIKPILDQIDAAKGKTLQAQAAAESWTASLGKVGPLVAAAFSGAAVTGFLGKVVAVQREFDVLNSSLKTVTGSSAAAEREMAWLKEFAKETPFGLAQATQGFVKMKALGLDPTRGALTSFGNTASAMGKDLNQMIEAVADASTGEFERLKEFGIKAKKEGDNVSLTFQGVTTTIRNNADEIFTYLERIGNVEFGGAMAERARTLDGNIAALGDTWDELFRTVSANNVGSLIFDSITLANGALEDATTILRALGGAAQDAGRDTGALSTIQNGIATVFETVSVLGANLKFVLVGIGNEIGGLAAQVAQAAQFNFSGVAAIRQAMVADAEAARKEIDATTERILRARKAQEEYARYATRNASAATDPRRIDLGSTRQRETPVSVPKPKKEDLSDYDKLIQKLGVEIPKAAAEAEAAQNGYNKAQTEFLELARSPAWAKFTESERARVAALFENKIASEQAAEAAKTLAKGNTDAAQARERYLASLDNGLDKIRADIQAQQDATQRMGLSKQAIADLDAAKLEMLATDLELQAIKAMDRNLDQQTYDALKKQAAGYRELAKAKQEGAAKEAAIEYEKASADAAQKAQEDWRRAAEDINNSLTDALLRGFESGKDFAKNMRDTVVNMFKTMVLRPIISMVLSPISGAISGMLGGGVAGGGSNPIGMASNAYSLYNTGSQAWTLGSQYLGGTMSGANAIGSMYANATGGGLDALLATNGAYGTAGGGAASGGGLGALGGAGAFAAVAAVILNGLGAFRSDRRVAGGLRGTLGGGDLQPWEEWREGGTLFSGPEYTTFNPVEALTRERARLNEMRASGADPSRIMPQQMIVDNLEEQYGDLAEQTAAQSNAIQTAYEALRNNVGDMADVLGISSDAVRAFTTELGGGKGLNFEGLTGEQVQAKIAEALATANNDLAKQIIGSWETVTEEMVRTFSENVGSQGEGQELVYREERETVTSSRYVESEYARDGEEAIDTLTRLATSLSTVNGAFGVLGVTLYEASLAGGDAASTLVDAFGGLDAFSAATSSYFENYYSQAEREAAMRKEVADTLAEAGIEMPRTRAEFRETVNALLEMGEAGAEAAAVMLGVQDEFAAITEGAGSMQDAFRVTADGLQSILEDAVTNAGSAAEASRNASMAFEESIYGGLQDSLLSDLSGLLSGAINPLIDGLIGGAAASSAALAAGGAAAASSMAAGGAIGASATAQGGAAAAGAMASGGSAAAGAMVSGGSAVGGVVSSVLDQARAYVNAYAQILADPAIKDVIGQISGMVGEVAGIAYTGINSSGGGGSWQSPGGPSSPAADKANDYNEALKSIGETIESEVKRLRGLMVEDSPFSKDVLLAQFTTATAQARAGDKDALAKLPDLSKAIEAASAVTAVSAVEMARTRGWLAGSLEETLKALGLTGAGGVTPVITPTTPTTTPATPAPQVITPIYNPAISGATMDPALLAAVKELNVTLKAIQSDGDADQVVNQNKLGAIHTTLRNIEELTALSLPTGVTA
jgi:hypothetical protein